jgi:uncharacterized protein (DUF2147 family)
MKRIWIVAIILTLSTAAHAQQNGVLGQWLTPVGATVEAYRCDSAVCLKLVALSKDAPSRVDNNNPNAGLRKRSLCGLQIGRGFHLADGSHAEGGQLYDPKSGKTYSGSIVSAGESLKLRGYVGIKLFGRSEVWKRAQGNVEACKE